MSNYSFSRYVPQGTPAPQKQGSQQADQSYSFSRFITGSNPTSTQNGWDTPFYQTFLREFRKAEDEGRAEKYFLNRGTGIAVTDQSGKDDAGVDQVVRAGDVFDNGQKVGNLYDKYGAQVAEQIMTPLLVDGKQQREGVTFAQVRSEREREMGQARTRDTYNAEVAKTKDDWGDNWDQAITAGGALGGAALGGSAGFLFGGPVGALVGGVIGGVAGGVGSWLNRDEIEDMAARGHVQAEMMERTNPVASQTVRLQTYSQLFGEFTNPLKQVVHGAAEVTWGKQGDDRSAFYETDATGAPVRSAAWTGADVAAGLGGAALQFASPVGRFAFQGQMLGQIGGKAGTLALTGSSFDDRRGEFDNVFLDEEGQFNVGSSLAGLGNVGIDVLQLGMGRSLAQYARNSWQVGAARRGGTETLAGFKFTTLADGTMKSRVSLTALAPSEMVQAMAARSTAMLTRGRPGRATPQELYEAASAIANGTNLRKAVLLNAFGEGAEEGAQTALEAISHQQSFTLSEVGEAWMMGAAMGAGMTIGSRAGAQRVDSQRFQRANQLNGLLNLPELDRSEWSKMSRVEQDAQLARNPEASYLLSRSAEKVAEAARTEFVAGVAGVERLRDIQHAQVARERASTNRALDGTYVLSKAHHDIDDHMVVGSLNTVTDLLTRHRAGLVEQLDQVPEELRARHDRTIAEAEQVLEMLRVTREDYDTAASPAEADRVLSEMNKALSQMWRIDAGDLDTIDTAKAVSVTISRSPMDNAGSLPTMLPQISLPGTRNGDDNFLQMTLGPTQGLSADFDGDKGSVVTRLIRDDDVFMSQRTGRNLLGAMDSVNIMTRAFEEEEVRLLGAALRTGKGAYATNAEAVVKAMEDQLRGLLQVDGNRFAEQEQKDFIAQLRSGNPKAKSLFFSALSKKWPAEMRAVSEAQWSNPWFTINSRLQRQLQNFQFANAATIKPAAVSHTVAPVRADSAVGKMIAATAASRSATVSLLVEGSDIFRKWQSLHYTRYNSPEMVSGHVDNETFAEMVALYEALTSGVSESQLDTLRNKDRLTARVASQLENLASRQDADFGSSRASMALLANLTVPDLQQGKFHGRTTLLRWLLLESADREEEFLRRAGTWDRDTDAQTRLSRIRSMNDGEAFVEVFGGWQFQDLLGLDAAVFGSNLTVAQWHAAYVNHDEYARAELARLLKLHVNYKAMQRDQGRHNLPYYTTDLEGPTAITAYQSVVDALLLSGNSQISLLRDTRGGTSRVGGRIGEASKRTSEALRSGLEKLQQAGASAGVKANSPEAWRAFLDQHPDAGRAFFALLPDNAADRIFRISPAGEVTVANWVYALPTMRPEQAEMELFRQTFLASWVSGVSSDEEDGGQLVGRAYHRLDDRLHQLAYRLVQDTRTGNEQRFWQALFTMEDVDSFLHFVNTSLRGNEAPFTAWSRDVAEIDSTVTKGGWQALLPGAAQRQAISEFNTMMSRATQWQAEERRRDRTDAEVYAMLQAAVDDPQSTATPLLENLRKAIDFSKRFRAGLGPAARQRANVASLLGVMANLTDKGKAAGMIAVNGSFDARGRYLTFGTDEEIAWSSATANSVDEAGADPSLLGMDDFELMDADGTTVRWDRLTAEEFVRRWAEPKNRPLLRAIVFPSVYEQTVEDRVDQVSIVDMSLAGLVQGNAMSDIVFSKSQHGKNVYLSLVESMAGRQAVQRYLNMVTVSALGGRDTQLQNPDEASRIVQSANAELADVLRMLGELSRTTVLADGVAVDPLELVRGAVLARLRANHSKTRPPLLDELDIDVLLLEDINRDSSEQMTPEARQLLEDQRKRLTAAASGSVADQVAAAYGLRPPKKGGTTAVADWMDATRTKRTELLAYVKRTADLSTMARWATGVPVMFSWKPGPNDPTDMLPELTPDQWVDVSRAVVANEIQLAASTTIPGVENVRPGSPADEQWLELHSTSFEYLANNLLSSSNPMVAAARELHREFNRPETGMVLEDDVVQKLFDTFLNPDRLGNWDDRIAEQISWVNNRIDASGTPQKISQAGMGPRNIDTENAATRRTGENPPASLRSTADIPVRLLDGPPATPLQTAGPGGKPRQIELSLLDGRAVSAATLTLADGTQVDLLAHARPRPGLGFTGFPDSDYEMVTVSRLRNSVAAYPTAASLSLEFLHPADQPDTPEYANNVFFEGTVLENDGDRYPSLIAALWLSPGGIDPTNSQSALQAAKKNLTALKVVDRLTSAEKAMLESGWQADMFAMLQRKATRLLTMDLGDGRFIRPEFRNALVKLLKMRHVVRLVSAEGGVEVLSAEQVIAQQAAGTFDISTYASAELVKVSDSALRTMLGEQGDRGELRPMMETPELDLTRLAPWTGRLSEQNLANLPGLLNTEPRSLFDTRAAQRRTQRRLSALTEMDTATRNSYLRNMLVEQQIATEIGEARQQTNNPGMYDRAAQAAANHISDSISNRVHLDMAKLGAGLPTTAQAPGAADALDQVVLGELVNELSSQVNATGWVYRFTLPEGPRGAFGELYGRDALRASPNRASHVAPGDLVSIDIDDLMKLPEGDRTRELQSALSWFTSTGAVISLTSKVNSLAKMEGAEYLKERGYVRLAGSDTLFQRNRNSDVSANTQARYDKLLETSGVETANLVVLAMTDHWGFEENAAGYTGKGMTSRMALVVDLVPTMSWPGFGLPLPDDMAEIRRRLGDEAVDGLVEQSELMAGRKLTKAERQELADAVAKARELLNDRGEYEPGHELQVGDIVPLWNQHTRQLILYRHGYKPPKNRGELDAQFAQYNTAVYGVEPLPTATTHSGKVIRFDRSSRHGLRVQLRVDLQTIADKVQVEGSGHKLLAVSMLDTLAGSSVEIPTGIPGWDVSYIAGLSDARSKENWEGLVDNFRNAIAYFGFDFRPVLAKALFGKSGEAEAAAALRVLERFRRSSRKITVEEAAELALSDSVGQLLGEQLAQLQDGGLARTADEIQAVVELDTPEARILRSALLYLQVEGAQLEHVLYSAGVNNASSRSTGTYARLMPRLFTQVFDRAAADDPLRAFMVQELNNRLDNPNAPYGWVLNNDLTVTFHNPNPKHTFTGYLQFAKLGSSGDNPVLNRMAQDRPQWQSASQQQMAVAAGALGARTSTTRELDKTAARIASQRAPKDLSGEQLLRDLRDIPAEVLDLPTQLLPAEHQYRAEAREVLLGLRQPLVIDGWSQSEKDEYASQRKVVAAAFGVGDSEVMVDYWVRYFLWSPKDPDPDGNPGRVNATDALEILEMMLQNHSEGYLPVAGAMVEMMHPVDLRAIHRAVERGESTFSLRDDGKVLTDWDDWVNVALGQGDPDEQQLDTIVLKAIDGNFHLYSELGMGLRGMSSSLYAEKADQLLDPETQELMLSISPTRAAAMARVNTTIAAQTLEGVLGGTGAGPNWGMAPPPNTAVGAKRAAIGKYRKDRDMPHPSSKKLGGLLRHGERLQTDGTVMNGALRTAMNLRIGLATLNPLLAVGAPLEQLMQTTTENFANLLTGDAYASHLNVGPYETRESARELRLQIDALAHNKEMRSLLFGEFGHDVDLYNAGPLERFSAKMVKLGGMIQNPYYKMRGNAIVRRYVEAAMQAYRGMGTATSMTSVDLVRNLSKNPSWLRDEAPDIHKMATRKVLEMTNTKDTSFTVAWRGIVDPLATSSRMSVAVPSTLALKLPYAFTAYTSNKLVQLLGLQGADAFIALYLHGRKKPGILGRLQDAAAGRPFSSENEVFDMSSVIETVDLTNAFIKSGITHSSLMALGLLSGGLGLSGEDEEDRRRRRAARFQGYAHILDPRDVVNDFRNADAVYLDWLPFGLDAMFKVPGHEDTGGPRAMAEMNWILRSIFSPMIGMERFHNTGNPWEIWWGFEDAFYSFPLVNTQSIQDAEKVFEELAAAALDAEAIGTPESLPQAFGWWMRAVMNLERMLLESSFINMLYTASDPYDRDAWAKPMYNEDGTLSVNKLGLPERTTALRDYLDEDTGEVAQGYVGRDWTDATVRGYAENRATLALLGTLYSKLAGTDGYMRADMVPKIHTIDKTPPSLTEAEAHVISAWKGLLRRGDPTLENFYIPLPMRNELEKKLKADLIQEGINQGLTDKAATSRMWTLWKGNSEDPTQPGLGKILYDKTLISYTEKLRYYQLNTTYVMGPDGRPWATGIDRGSFANLAGLAPLHRYIVSDGNTLGTDARLNTTDRVANINTGLRGLTRIDESFKQDVDPTATAAGSALQNSYNTGSSGWVDYGKSGWTNYGRRGWTNYGRRGWSSRRSGGGGGGSATRINTPERQQVPYANDIQNINTSNPIIRRATIRRERIDSQKGRLKSWQ